MLHYREELSKKIEEQFDFNLDGREEFNIIL